MKSYTSIQTKSSKYNFHNHSVNFHTHTHTQANLEQTLYGVETGTLRKVDQKHLESSGNVLLKKDGVDQLDR
jgi:hypothetical protein